MEWLLYLLLLICPLMMIFMMKGHGGHRHGHQHHGMNPSKNWDSKLMKMEQENEKLRKELNDLSTMVKKNHKLN